MTRFRILFLCTGNSCRSQMAEGWARHLLGDRVEAVSAGLEAHGLNPWAVQVMAEAGVDLSCQRSRRLEDLPSLDFDLVVTVCSHAHEHCPLFPGPVRVLHQGFDDPPRLAQELTDAEARLEIYRRVRDEIRAFVAGLPESGLFAHTGDPRPLQGKEGPMSETRHDQVRGSVRERYASIATLQSGSCCGGGASCCTPSDAAATSATLGYSNEELAAVPEGSNLGLGCGNPQAIAGLTPGETVLDLGSGAGFDCFLAARQVGPSGRVIGVDMTPDMLSKARSNAEQGGYSNVDFRLGEIEHLPVADGSVDVILSNCVINLSPDKAQVFREAFRVLKSGGRLAVSDVVALRPLPESLLRDMDAWCGCVSGAALVTETEAMLRAAGFREVRVAVKEESRAIIREWFPGSGAEEYVASAEITALR